MRREIIAASLFMAGLGSLQAFVDEEKPCGHAYGNEFLRDMAPTTEQQKLDIQYYSIDLTLDLSNSSMVKQFLIQFEVLDSTVQMFEFDYSNSNLGVGNI